MLTRREWLHATGGLSASAWCLGQLGAENLAAGLVRSPAPALPPFVDPLPIPPVLRTPRDGTPLRIRLRPCTQRIHRDLSPTPVWGYNGIWPGPTIEVRRGEPLAIEWINELPDQHFLPVDPTIHGAGPAVPAVRAVTHVHGARALPDSDGHPEAWSTANGRAGRLYRPGPYRYGNDQPAATLWYHDHALGITRLNVYAGLAGLYLIRDDEETALGLPSGAFDLPLLLQDRLLSADGTLLYPTAKTSAHPIWAPECFGDTVCVNGKAAPFLAVEPRRYRWRVVNGSNARFYRLAFVPANPTEAPATQASQAPVLHQIGSDGGLLPAPLALRSLLLAPGERADLVVDFSGHVGARFVLMNDAPAPYVRGGGAPATDVLLVTVSRPLSSRDDSRLPPMLAPVPLLDPQQAVGERLLAITETEDRDGTTLTGLLDHKHWMDPVSEEPEAGSLEVWTFANATGDVHPMHMHLTRFQVLNRQQFDVRAYVQTGRIVFASPPLAVEQNERPAWKDTVKTYPGTLTRIIQRL